MGRVLTKFQQLGFRALVPQTSSPFPRLSRRVIECSQSCVWLGDGEVGGRCWPAQQTLGPSVLGKKTSKRLISHLGQLTLSPL